MLETNTHLELGFEEKLGPWRSKASICRRKPIDIAVDGCNHCYKCAHHIDLHASDGACNLCVALSDNKSYMSRLGKIPRPKKKR